MALSRREFLSSTAAVVGSNVLPSVLHSSAQAATGQRPFLYSLEDYIDPQKKLIQFGRMYLDELQGFTAIYSWTLYCRTCYEEIPELNAASLRFKDSLHFLGVLGGISNRITGSPEKEFQLCVELWRKPEEYCERWSRSEFDPHLYRPVRRKEFGEEIFGYRARKQQQGKWPLFPVHVVDDQYTRRYFQEDYLKSVVVLKEGKFYKKLRFADKQGRKLSLEKQLVQLIKT